MKYTYKELFDKIVVTIGEIDTGREMNSEFTPEPCYRPVLDMIEANGFSVIAFLEGLDASARKEITNSRGILYPWDTRAGSIAQIINKEIKEVI